MGRQAGRPLYARRSQCNLFGPTEKGLSRLDLPKLSGRVLVLGEDTRAFLAVIRSLGRAGLDVHTAWCPLSSPALRSRYVGYAHRVAEYRVDDDQWLDDMRALMQREKFDLVLPCTDGSILPLQLHRDQLEPSGRIWLLPDDVYRTCASKAQTHALATSLGIPVAQQRAVNTIEEAGAAAARFNYPVVLKPETSATAANPLVRRSVRQARDALELRSLAASMLEAGSVLVEEHVTGRGVGVEFLSRDGEVLTAFQHERVHEPLTGGGSSYRKSVPLDAGMYEATKRITAALRYTGVGMVEFKRNDRTGAWILIEINARFWGSLPLSIAAGLDFPRYLYELLVRGETRVPASYRTNLYCRHWTSDMRWLVANARADRRDSLLMTRPLRAVAAEALNVLALRERSDTFQISDPAPAVHDLAAVLHDVSFAIGKRLGPWRAWKRKRAVARFRRARSVVFVCHGNICRSPFAARLLGRTAKDLHVTSAGCHPKTGRPSPENAIRAAASFGVDLEDHRSTVLSDALAEQADVIFIFDERNQRELAKRFKGIEAKVHFFGSLDPEHELEIADPYGGSMERFLSCYARIERIVRAVCSTA
jgi:protein-tyrosine-phosphatase/predicted ATP-grasp superfamily ATP-dependent carboligase